MNILTQEAKKRQAIVKCALKKGKSYASRQYGVNLSSVKQWCKRCDVTWQSLTERSHRPKKSPTQHTRKEEKPIQAAFAEKYERYGWDGVYDELVKNGYKRSYSGMVYAAKLIGLGKEKKKKKKKPTRVHLRRYPETLIPGEKVQIDVKEVPFNCLRGAVLRDGKHLYQWTAIDECTRVRFVYAFEEHFLTYKSIFIYRNKNRVPIGTAHLFADLVTISRYTGVCKNGLSCILKHK